MPNQFLHHLELSSDTPKQRRVGVSERMPADALLDFESPGNRPDVLAENARSPIRTRPLCNRLANIQSSLPVNLHVFRQFNSVLIKVALILRNGKLIDELQKLSDSFHAKGNEYLEVVKMGRTELQDAVPMTVGQEFHAFGSSLDNEIQFLRDSEKALYTVNMGATAIGTGLNVPKGYPEKFAEHLSKLLNKPIVPAPDMLSATWDQQGFVIYSSALKSLAIKLSKISSDLILLSSGPRAGLFEVNLPALQPGSSIMPGKVNPVVPEVVNLVAFRVMGNDFVVTLAAHSGELQLNAYEPIEGLALIESQSLLFNTSILFRTKCVDGITVNKKQLQHYMETTVGIVTALNPILGYEKTSELAQEAYSSGKGILEIVQEQHLLTDAQIKELLDPAKLTGLDKTKYQAK